MKSLFLVLVTLLVGTSAFAFHEIIEIEGIGNTFQGCVSAKRDALNDLAANCRQGHIDGISCSTMDFGQTDSGHLCKVHCTAFCITRD
jgi:hypothetical protein